VKESHTKRGSEENLIKKKHEESKRYSPLTKKKKP
jgi:hypothetical protein